MANNNKNFVIYLSVEFEGNTKKPKNMLFTTLQGNIHMSPSI